MINDDLESNRSIIKADKLFEYIQEVETTSFSINSVVKEEPEVPFMFYLFDGYSIPTPLYFNKTGAVFETIYKEDYGAFLVLNSYTTKESVEKAVTTALRRKMGIDLNEDLALYALKRKSKIVFADKREIERYYKNQQVALCRRNVQILKMIATLVRSSENLMVKSEFLENLNSMNDDILTY